MTTLRQLQASSEQRVSHSRLVVLQAKRLMLGFAERRYRRTASREHLRRVRRLRAEVDRARDRYAGAWASPDRAMCSGAGDVIRRGNRSLDRLRRLQRRLPAERRWEAAIDIELLEEQMRVWERGLGR